jgi:large subunit ribosomal protein L25
LEIIELNASIRSKTGNSPARALRRAGMLPAVLYGPGIEAVSLTLDAKDLKNALKKGKIGQSLFNLKVGNGDGYIKTVMIKELQSHPLTHSYIHADFYEIAMDRKITVAVPVVTTGKCKGVELGGLLQVIRRELEITCLPGQIPGSVILDVSDLDVGDSIHVEDVPLPEGVEIHTDINFTIITVSAPKADEGSGGEVQGGAEEASSENS